MMRLSTASLCVAASLMLLLCSGATATPRKQHQRQAFREVSALTGVDEYQKVEQELGRGFELMEEVILDDSNTTTVEPPPTTITTTVEPIPTTITTTVDPNPTTITTTVEPNPTTITTTVEPNPTTITTTVAPQSTTTTATPLEAPELSGGAIAGIVIGSLAGVALIGGGVYFLYTKKMYCFSD